MKKIYLYFILIIMLLSCSVREAPITVYAPTRVPDSHGLENFKSKKDKPIVIGMHYDIGAKSGYDLMNTPDSLDMIVLKNNYMNFNPVLLDDIDFVRHYKRTRVLLGLDLHAMISEVAKQIRKEYNEAKKQQDRQWGDQRPEAREVAATYSKLKEKIVTDNKEKLIKKVDVATEQLPGIAKVLGVDGFSIQLPYDYDMINQDKLSEIIEKFAKISGKDKNFILMIENPLIELKGQIAKADYVISCKRTSKLQDITMEAEQWSEQGYLPSFDVTDTKLSESYEDNPVFSYPLMSKDRSLLKWTASNKKGIAIYHSEQMYYDVQNYQGYIYTYAGLRRLIREVNMTK